MTIAGAPTAPNAERSLWIASARSVSTASVEGTDVLVRNASNAVSRDNHAPAQIVQVAINLHDHVPVTTSTQKRGLFSSMRELMI